MALISKVTIQEVNNRLDAIAVAGDYIRLEKKSGRWWGRCPFHAGGQEKTPSFKVDPDLKMYHCFGCNKGGSIISFVMEMENISYPEAIKNLAKKIGIQIIYEEGIVSEEENNENITVKEELYELYKRTAVTFTHFLLEKPEGQDALKYLGDRGITKEIINIFRLGFSPVNRDFLHKFLKQKGYSDEFLVRSGLFSAKYKTIPLFTGRLMFPITDRQGKTVAFGGRTLPSAVQNDGNEPPKYINSPETEIYKKGQTLFALDLAKPEMRKTKRVFLAEGYMDVIALHQAGVANSVAPLGTAFTDDQARFLNRWVEKIILILDNDEAGKQAAYKAILTCKRNGLSCLLVNQTEALKMETGDKNNDNFKDPADILKEFGSQILKKILNYTINDFEYLISLGLSKFGSGGSKNRAAEFLFPYFEALDSEVERNDCIYKAADSIRTDRNSVQKDYINWKKEGYSSRFSDNGKQAGFNESPIRRNAELVLLTAVAVNMEIYPEFRAALEINEIHDQYAKELFIALEECFQYGETGMDSLLSRIKRESLKDFIINNGDSPEFRGGLTSNKLMEDGIREIKKNKLRKRLTEIGAEIRQIERSGDDDLLNENINDLLEEKKKIDIQIRSV
ncbi:MAG: DNA primase [Treponema sp.]|nr:DNA primase [Treponema sp.]